ncbi:zinc finger and SCAN domain-containing protein 31 [Aedes albopictus]|uniref:C2h2-type zn-finger protein n=1 Tax=Aedes albopictus TaxID=7160 RepID=A0ABM1YLM3_AEDAL|nr:zinc finger and SCAN domain-containing protein 31 [Aedes albopictus]
MSRRSATASEVETPATNEPKRASNKRPYTRKSLLCRLCLRVLPKEQLPEIFTYTFNLSKAIRLAVGTEVSKKDRSVRICYCCLELVQVVNDFRGTCERAEVLFTQNVEFAGDAFWQDESDQQMFDKCRTMVEKYKAKVEDLLARKLEIICDIKPETELEESASPESETVERSVVIQVDPVEIDEEGNIVKQEPDEPLYLDEEHLEQPSGSEQDFDGSELDDPDYVEEQNGEQNEGEDSKTKQCEKIQALDPDAPPRRRRGRPSLPEEMLKRRRRQPGEPRRRPGPKNHFKLPPQSICEICGVMVSRENQERHRNEHLGHRPYACTVEGCTHAFTSKSGLHGHLARHADRDNVYDCDICGKKIKTKSSLHRHKKLHTAEKPHGCDICGKRFWRRAYLNHHATVHTGVAKFPCEYCGFVFKNKYWRSFHIKQKHVAKGEAPRYEALDELPENGEMAEVAEDGLEMGQIIELDG